MIGGSIAVMAAVAFAMPARQVTAPALHAASPTGPDRDGSDPSRNGNDDGAGAATTPPTPDGRVDPRGASTDDATASTAFSDQIPLDGADAPSDGVEAAERAGDARPTTPDADAPGRGSANDGPGASSVRVDGRANAVSWLEGPPPQDELCPTVARSVVIDRRWQRAWVCADGDIATIIPVTTARDQPDPGDYPVYARDWQSFSDQTPRRSWLDRFIAFTRGKHEGLRIGFHAVPYYDGGRRLQPLESVGALDRFGTSDGCIRLRPEHAELLWNFLQEGDTVRILN